MTIGHDYPYATHEKWRSDTKPTARDEQVEGDAMTLGTQHSCELCGEEAWGEGPHLACMQKEQASVDMTGEALSEPGWRTYIINREQLERQVSVDDVFTSLGCQEEVTRDFIAVALQDIILFDKKQHDRGPENIARHGEKGVVLRLWDKLARINRIVWDGVQPTISESVEQEFADLSVYGVIARLCLAGRWPQIGRQPEGRCSACQQRYEYEHPAHPG